MGERKTPSTSDWQQSISP